MGLFSNQTELIGVSNMNPDTTKLSKTFANCTKLRFVDNIGELVNVQNMESAKFALTMLKQNYLSFKGKNVFIIGGGSIYE